MHELFESYKKNSGSKAMHTFQKWGVRFKNSGSHKVKCDCAAIFFTKNGCEIKFLCYRKVTNIKVYVQSIS